MVKETSANKLIRDNWIGQTERYEIAANAAQNFSKHLEQVGNDIDQPLRDRIQEVYDSDKLITQQRQRLSKQTTDLNKTTKQIQNLTDSALNRVKETGDVQNWAEMIDERLRILEQTVEYKSSS